MDALEFWGQISLLKGGIVFSDSITTVSPTYAREIQTKEYGFGFEGVLATRAADLHGILNGIDTDRWDPRRDPFLPEPYDEHSLEKKDAAKRALVRVARARARRSSSLQARSSASCRAWSIRRGSIWSPSWPQRCRLTAALPCSAPATRATRSCGAIWRRRIPIGSP